MTTYAEVHSQQSTLVVERVRIRLNDTPSADIVFMRLATRFVTEEQRNQPLRERLNIA